MIAIRSSRTFEEALKQLLDGAVDLTGMEGGGVYLIERDTAVFRCMIAKLSKKVCKQ